MSDLGAGGEPVHSATKSGEAVCPHQRWMVRVGLMEKIMSRAGHNTEVCELTESELEKVSGGEEKNPIFVWHQLLGQLGLAANNGGGFSGALANCLNVVE